MDKTIKMDSGSLTHTQDIATRADRPSQMTHNYKYENLREEDRNSLIPAIQHDVKNTKWPKCPFCGSGGITSEYSEAQNTTYLKCTKGCYGEFLFTGIVEWEVLELWRTTLTRLSPDATNTNALNEKTKA